MKKKKDRVKSNGGAYVIIYKLLKHKNIVQQVTNIVIELIFNTRRDKYKETVIRRNEMDYTVNETKYNIENQICFHFL